ncbi:MAG: DUF721 domain-containing protein [Veillonellaceae bacterium]|nr:DUF721 domain-containing protein [Veillonellaceae bacterium]
MDRIDGILSEWQQRWGDNASFQIFNLKHAWPVIVGTMLAKKSYPTKLEDAVLHVYAENSVWLQELFMRKDAVLESIRKHCPQMECNDIVLRIGRAKIAEKEKKAAAAEAQPVPLQKEEVAAVRESLNASLPPDLSEALFKLRIEQLRLRNRKQSLGWHPCPRCGEQTAASDLCGNCVTKESEEKRYAVLRYLKRNPAASYPEAVAETGCAGKEYEKAKQQLIYRLLDCVYNRHDTAEERRQLLQLITGRPLADLSEAFQKNLLNKLNRRKEE